MLKMHGLIKIIEPNNSRMEIYEENDDEISISVFLRSDD